MPSLVPMKALSRQLPLTSRPSLRRPTQTISEWVARDGCKGKATRSFERGDTRCDTHAMCERGVEVTLCTIEEGGHTWPGGLDIAFLGKTSHDIDANDAMWEFFEQHPLP